MTWLIALVLGGIIFYLRFLWAMHKERKRSRSVPVVAMGHKIALPEIDLSELWEAELDAGFYLEPEKKF
ncbi:MAG: hypothetical protein ACHQIK_21260 [Candidatus Acidiferrales bacterium]